jgi:P-type E1-E2 ATPase
VIELPTPERTALEHLVLDFNGTLACDGVLIPGAAPLIERLAGGVAIHVVTGDTFGGATQALSKLPCSVKILAARAQSEAKRDYVQQLGPHSVACIGNGRNDVLMMRLAALSIAVLQREGAAAPAIAAADVVCSSIEDALGLLLNPRRLLATLRE